MTTGERIKVARKAAKLTQAELAERLGLATGTVQQYELNKREPGLDRLLEIAFVLNVQPGQLLSDKPKSFPNGKTFDAAREKAAKEAEEKGGIETRIASRPGQKDEITIWNNPPKALKDRIDIALGKLNTQGQEVAAERVEELTEIPKYLLEQLRKHPEYQKSPPQAAAQAGEKGSDQP